jgi:flagellar hook-basal body complex protein FliE
MKEIHIDSSTRLSTLQFSPKAAEGGVPAESFGEAVQAALTDLSRLQQQSDLAVEHMLSGRKVDVHQTMVALEKASVSFQLIMQVRNKIVSAYEEIMRMQL